MPVADIENRVYGDGERMIVGLWGGDSIVLHRPVITQIQLSMHQEPEYSYLSSPLGYHKVNMGPSWAEMDLKIRVGKSEWIKGGVPDLSSLADSLTVGQLFAAINRKLDVREVG